MMESFGTITIIEGKSFMMNFNLIDSSFSIKSCVGDNITLADHIGEKINTDDVSNDLFEKMPMFSGFSISKVNYAKEINARVVDSQSIKMKKGYIYLISDGTYTKIGGTTFNVKKRLIELQTGNAKRLYCIGKYKVDYLLQSERMVQEKYIDKCILNEWFELTNEDIDNILLSANCFTPTKEIFKLSIESEINILYSQIVVLEDAREYYVKKAKRNINKVELPMSKEFISMLKKGKINDVEKYSQFKKHELDKYIKNSEKTNKILDKIESIDKYRDFLYYEMSIKELT